MIRAYSIKLCLVNTYDTHPSDVKKPRTLMMLAIFFANTPEICILLNSLSIIILIHY